MSREPKDMSGALFTNKKKEKDTHPDYQGNITIGGKEYWLSGWKKQYDGGAYLSISAKVKEPKAAVKAEAPKPYNRAALDDEIPF